MTPASNLRPDRMVTVCAACLCASCWHGEFYCSEAQTAGAVEKPVRELRRLKLEHRYNYSVAKVRNVCGS